MGSHPTRLAMLIAVALVAAANAQSQSPAQPFVAGTSLVVVPASVVDKKGQAVTSLTKDDFEVRDDGHGGRPHSIDVRVKRPGVTVRARQAR